MFNIGLKMVSIFWALVQSRHLKCLFDVFLIYKPCDIPLKYRCSTKKSDHISLKHLGQQATRHMDKYKACKWGGQHSLAFYKAIVSSTGREAVSMEYCEDTFLYTNTASFTQCKHVKVFKHFVLQMFPYRKEIRRYLYLWQSEWF